MSAKMTKHEFLISSGMEITTLDLWISQEWLIPETSEAGMLFGDIDVARARFINELKDDFGANDAGIDVILHLVDQLHEMRRALGGLRDEMQSALKPDRNPKSH